MKKSKLIKPDEMQSGSLYRIENKGRVWLIRFQHEAKYESRKNKNGYEFLYRADILAQSSEAEFSKPMDYMNHFFESSGIEVRLKELPLYIGYYVSPLFDRVLRGELEF